jgi:hypothetical protein
MGLDMTLYVVEDPELDLNEEKACVSYEILDSYSWRKANQIHKWFVENIQDGEDDCGIYEVEFDKLMDLQGIVETVASNPQKWGPKLLPTRKGFFFGNTEYNQWYEEDIQITKKHLNDIERNYYAKPETRFYYSSSW